LWISQDASDGANDEFGLLLHNPAVAGLETGTLRASFQEIGVSAGCGDDSCGVRAGFADEGLDAELLWTLGASQSGDACADDDDFLCLSHR